MKRTRTKLHFQLSGFNTEAREKLSRAIQSLGGVYHDTDSFKQETTHVICGKLSRGEKFLGALATGKWILTKEFIDKSLAQKSWVDENVYEWCEGCHMTKETPLWFLTAPRRWRQHVAKTGKGAFHGWKVALMVEMGKRRTVYKRLLESGGALVKTIPNTDTNLKDALIDLTHIILDCSHTELKEHIKGCHVSCFTPEYIGEFLLKETPDPTPFLVPSGGDLTTVSRHQTTLVLTAPVDSSKTKKTPVKKVSSSGKKLNTAASSSKPGVITKANKATVLRKLPSSQSPKLAINQPTLMSFFAKSPSPVARSQTPVARSQTPFARSQTPVAGSQTPVARPQTPVATSQTPVARSQTPVAASKTPVAMSQTPVAGCQTPIAGSQTPVAVSQTPVARSQTPVASSRTLIATSQTPVVASQTPVAGSLTAVARSPTPARLSQNIPQKPPKNASVIRTRRGQEKENKMQPYVLLKPLSKKIITRNVLDSNRGNIDSHVCHSEPIMCNEKTPTKTKTTPFSCPVSPLTTAVRRGIKRNIFSDEEISGALQSVKKQKINNYGLPWIPTSFNVSRQDLLSAEIKRESGKIPVPMASTFTGIFETCFDEDHHSEALDTLLSTVSSMRYPQPCTLNMIMTNILQPSCSSLLSNKAYSVLRMVLCLHPPTTPALKDVYVKSLCSDGQHDAHPGQEWRFLHNVIRSVIDNYVSDTADDMKLVQENNTLLLQFLLAVLEQDFQDYLYRYKQNDNNKKQVAPCIVSRIMWPVAQKGAMNTHIKELMAALFDFMEYEVPVKEKLKILNLLQSLVAMVAECCHLADQKRKCSSGKSLGEKATHFAKEMGHRAYGILDESTETLSHFLSSVQLPWLCCKICETLLDFYDDALLPPDPDAPPYLTLKTIVSRHLYLLPQSLVTNFSKSPHKKAFIPSQNNGISEPKQLMASPSFAKAHTTPSKKARPSISGILKSPPVKLKNMNKKNAKGETALHVACMKNNVAKLKELLAIAGIDVNSQDYAGWTPLHEACNYGHIECVTELLRYRPPKTIHSYFSAEKKENMGINVLIANEEGITALHDAVSNNHVEVARLLLLYGGTKLLRAQTKDGKTATDFAWTPEMKNVLSTPQSPAPSTPSRRALFSSSQGSQSSQERGSQKDAALSYMPAEDMYVNALTTDSGENLVEQEDCSKYIIIIFHLIKSYVKVHDLHLLRSLIQNSVREDQKFMNENMCSVASLPSSGGNTKTSTTGQIASLKGIDDNVTSKDKVTRKNQARDLAYYGADLGVLNDLAKHIQGFESHLRRIVKGHEIDRKYQVKLIALKLLGW